MVSLELLLMHWSIKNSLEADPSMYPGTHVPDTSVHSMELALGLSVSPHHLTPTPPSSAHCGSFLPPGLSSSPVTPPAALVHPNLPAHSQPLHRALFMLDPPAPPVLQQPQPPGWAQNLSLGGMFHFGLWDLHFFLIVMVHRDDCSFKGGCGLLDRFQCLYTSFSSASQKWLADGMECLCEIERTQTRIRKICLPTLHGHLLAVWLYLPNSLT